ncbi:hypothetical protein [Candidatus Neptunochlamydia vexilliferae]|nr:hypothetical protein [Candidatus Neptunochlamydia vexilliferae]
MNIRPLTSSDIPFAVYFTPKYQLSFTNKDPLKVDLKQSTSSKTFTAEVVYPSGKENFSAAKKEIKSLLKKGVVPVISPKSDGGYEVSFKKGLKTAPQPLPLIKELIIHIKKVLSSTEKAAKKFPIPLPASLNEKTIKENTQIAATFIQLAQNFSSQGDFKQALKQYKQALLYTERSQDYAPLIDIYKKNDQPKKAAFVALVHTYLKHLEASKPNDKGKQSNSSSQASSSSSSSSTTQVFNTTTGRKLPDIAIGKAVWEKHFGKGSIEGEEGTLPDDIEDILNAPTPFKVEGFSGKVRDTHILVWIPERVKGINVSLNSLSGLFNRYSYYHGPIGSKEGNKSTGKAHWVLMSKGLIEGTRNKSYIDHKKTIDMYACQGYVIPRAIDLAASLLIYEKATQQRLLPINPYTYARCQEKITNNQPVAIGNFGNQGFRVDFRYENYPESSKTPWISEYHGVALLIDLSDEKQINKVKREIRTEAIEQALEALEAFGDPKINELAIRYYEATAQNERAYSKAIALAKNSKPEKAIEYYQKALSLNPSAADAYKELKKLYDQLPSSQRTQSNFHLHLARFCSSYAQNKFQAAKDHYKQAQSLIPNSSSPMLTQLTLIDKKKEPKTAAVLYKELMEISGKKPKLYTYALEKLLKLNQRGETTKLIASLALRMAKLETEVKALKKERKKTHPLNTDTQQKFPDIAIGKAVWEKYFGKIGKEPPLPSNIEEILDQPCPFGLGKTVRDSHILVLIPETVNGKALTLNHLEQIIKSKDKSPYTYSESKSHRENLRKEVWNKPASPSHWVLMTRTVVPDSYNKNYEQQKKFFESTLYEHPPALDVAAASWVHHLYTGDYLYSEVKTRCKEKVKSLNLSDVTVGMFSKKGLDIRGSRYTTSDDGAIAWRNLTTEVIRNTEIQNKFSHAVFGKSIWQKHFKNVEGAEAPLPANIEEILSAPAPFEVEGYRKDIPTSKTHILVWIPEKINGIPLSLDTLGMIFKKKYRNHEKTYVSHVKTEVGSKKVNKPHWVLISKNVIKGSREKTYDTQKQLIGNYASKGYHLPKAVDVVTALFLIEKQTGEKLLAEKPFTYTRCEDLVNAQKWPVAVGGFGESIEVCHSSKESTHKHNGIVGFRNLSTQISRNTLVQQRFPNTVFGKTIWQKHFKNIEGTEAPLPADIEEILSAPAPFEVEGYKKDAPTSETHILVWIPEKVDGIGISLNGLQNLFGNHRFYKSEVEKELGEKINPSSHWILLSKNVLEGTREQTYSNQKKLLKSYASQGYVLPTALDVTTALLLHYKEKGKKLLSSAPNTYTRCQESINNNQWPLDVGGLSDKGLCITYDYGGSGNFNYKPNGMIAARTLESTQISRNTEIQKKFLHAVFGKSIWESHFKNVEGAEPPLPANIEEILSAPAPFEVEGYKKDAPTSETHILVWIPEKVDGVSLSLNNLQNLFGNYHGYSKEIKNEHGSKTTSSAHWILLSRNILKGTRGKGYPYQKKVMAAYSYEGYNLPSSLDIAAALLLYQSKNKKNLFPKGKDNNFSTLTRCLESVTNNNYPVAIGNSEDGRLYVHMHTDSYETSGIIGAKLLTSSGLSIQQRFRDTVFGKSIWQKHFKNIEGAEGPLPANIEEILKAPTTFKVEGYTERDPVHKTHLLVWVPRKVNGENLTLNNLQNLFGKYNFYSDHVKNYLGNKEVASHWILVSKGVLEGTRTTNTAGQLKIVDACASKGYALPTALDAAVVTLLYQKEKSG